MPRPPQLTFKAAPHRAVRALSRYETGQHLGLTPLSVQRLEESGYLPGRSEDAIFALADRAHLVASDTAVLVVQSGPAQSTDDEWRSQLGNSVSMPDDVWINALRGDWRGFDPAGKFPYMLVAQATFITGILRIGAWSSETYAAERITRHRYEAQLVARIEESAHPLADLELRWGAETTDAERAFATELIGARIRARKGLSAFPFIGENGPSI